MLNKKHREGESPDGEDIFTLTPQTEEKYKKIDEEFDKMMQTYRLTVSNGGSPLAPLRMARAAAGLCALHIVPALRILESLTHVWTLPRHPLAWPRLSCMPRGKQGRLVP